MTRRWLKYGEMDRRNCVTFIDLSLLVFDDVNFNNVIASVVMR